jgi:hypothetical protein
VTSQDTRRHKRYDVDGVEGSLVVSTDARILNMSLTGLAVETTSLLRLGASYTLRLPQGDSELRLKTTVEWCHLVGTRRTEQGDSVAVYQAGLDFRESLDERARQILAFLQEHIVMDVNRRLAGRFRPRQRLAAALSTRYPFEVRRLSLSGMLIDTPYAPDVGDQLEMEVDSPTGTFAALGAVRYVQQGSGEKLAAGGGSAASPASPEPGWMAGVEFASLEPEARESLTRLIQSLIE